MISRHKEAIYEQRGYYNRTCDRYDDLHLRGESAHDRAAHYVSSIARGIGTQTLLDVGCGTGRGAALLERGVLKARVYGIEPSAEMLKKAVQRTKGNNRLLRGSGEMLPFGDRGIDVACAFGVMHHVPDPSPVVLEMIRVANKAVFISDSNRFGQGRLTARLIKIGLAASGLWPVFFWMKTRGRGYQYSEGDGISFSYSVYDSTSLFSNKGFSVFFIPTHKPFQAKVGIGRYVPPILTSPQLLLCALRDDCL